MDCNFNIITDDDGDDDYADCCSDEKQLTLTIMTGDYELKVSTHC